MSTISFWPNSFDSSSSADAEPLLVCDGGAYRPAAADEVLRAARRLLSGRGCRGMELSSPQVAKDLLQVQLGGLEHEVFTVLYLDAQNRLIANRELFRGTVTHTAVHPREVAKEGIALNAVSVILAHNHPSGTAEPSNADLVLTQRLRKALELIDIRVIDHMVVTGTSVYSFAEHGLM